MLEIIGASAGKISVVVAIPSVRFSKLLIALIVSGDDVERFYRLSIVEPCELSLVAHLVKDLNFCYGIGGKITQRKRRVAAEEWFSVHQYLLNLLSLRGDGPVGNNHTRKFPNEVFRNGVWICLECSGVEFRRVCFLNCGRRRPFDVHFSQLNGNLCHQQVCQVHRLAVDMNCFRVHVETDVRCFQRVRMHLDT